MSTTINIEEAVELLQQFGLKEYEARCFVGLSRRDTATAKQLAEMTEVPRTRVYDAIRVLESQGLVQIHHTSPQQFRAIPLAEATETLRDQYENRVERLHNALDSVELVDPDDDSPLPQVWAISQHIAIENRSNQLISKATNEIVLVLGDETLLTDELVETLNEVGNGVDLVIGALTPSLEEDIKTAVPDAKTFVSGLEWLHGIDEEDETAIGRLVLIDRSTILVSSIMPDTKEEKAIFGEGFGNGLVIIARRLMAQGLLTERNSNSSAGTDE